jgi:membrane protease YdiL (CAAX protease family)
MTKLLYENPPAGQTRKTEKWWVDPVTWVFTALAAVGFIVSSIQSSDWLSGILFIIMILLAVVLVLFLSRKMIPESLEITQPSREILIAGAWLVIFLVTDFLTKGERFTSNEFSKWLWFIILPIALIYISRRQKHSFQNLLRSIGFQREGLKKKLLLSLAAFVVMIPAIPFIVPEAQLQKFLDLFQKPLSAAGLLLLSFVLSFLTAALTEEIFFRGIIQSRLAKYLGNEWRACLITAFLFGIYHLPYAYYLKDWPTHGNFLWAVSSVLQEQMIAGLLMGVLWFRTKNIFVPVLYHALVNLMPIMTSLHFSIG